MGNGLEEVLAFVRSVRAGSFSAAAREMGVTPSAISKKVARLEDRLGVPLLNRNTRRLGLTDPGLAFFERCAASLDGIEEAQDLVSRFREEPHGLLRVSVPQGFGRIFVAPFVPDLLARFPDLRIDLRFGHLAGNIIDERVDVLIGSADPGDVTLMVRTLMPMNRVTCAAPTYFERHGRPAGIDDLARHNCLIFTDSDSPDHEWVYQLGTASKRLRVTGSYRTNNLEALHQALLEGLGILHIPRYIVAGDIASGALVELFSDEPAVGQRVRGATMNAYYAQSRHQLPKVRLFIDGLMEYLKIAAHTASTAGTASRSRRADRSRVRA